jgi:hypothetical protein
MVRAVSPGFCPTWYAASVSHAVKAGDASASPALPLRDN